MFKLCVKGGYRTEIYSGKVNDNKGSVAGNIVMRLMDGLLDSGRTVFCDNWYFSVGLIRRLLERKTDFVGTFREQREGFPSALTKKKMPKDTAEAMQS
ncbi:unnamed protein product [Haemonchus placei]|uniref:DDE_Tnp_1_7 domain-containing protein n=1 Tax=Haemonchus placei TaxID=6290 RepID=A0A0N4WYZ7_HAEPC|nr:unnamed protein product [Haemonchus placei]